MSGALSIALCARRRNPVRLSLGLLAIGACLSVNAAVTPVPVGLEQQELSIQRSVTGLIENSKYYGSGVVARHPKLVISCAHVAHDGRSSWLGNPYWYRAWNATKVPSRGLLLNGYVYWSSYSYWVKKYGYQSKHAFELDLVAYYNYSTETAGGQYAEYWPDGVGALKSNAGKLITGYPMGRYPRNDSRRYQLHETGPFYGRFYDERGRYLGLSGVETGRGNSGGPVWVFNSGKALLAGILVSGREYDTARWSSVGVVGLDVSGWGLIESAINQSKIVSKAFTDTRAEFIADPGSFQRVIEVSGMPEITQSLEVSLEVLHPRPADLVVTLRSPTGRSVTLFDGAREKAVNRIAITSRPLPVFDRLNPNGQWMLTVRDLYRQNIGSFKNLTLLIRAN